MQPQYKGDDDSIWMQHNHTLGVAVHKVMQIWGTGVCRTEKTLMSALTTRKLYQSFLVRKSYLELGFLLEYDAPPLEHMDNTCLTRYLGSSFYIVNRLVLHL